MFVLVPSLLSVLLVYTNQVAATCESNQCQSRLDSSKCVELLGAEDLDCVTYTCKFDARVGHGVLVRDQAQESRCSIGGHCYKAGEGPNLCTFCQSNEDGTVSVEAGCLKPDGNCVAPGSIFQDACDLMICTVEHNAATIRIAGTTGCEMEGKCYTEGEKTYRYTCNECRINPDSYCHEWHKECRDPRNNQCFPRDSVYDIFCRTFICSNRGGIGWHRHAAQSCQISENDCIAVGSSSLRDGYCYYCDNAEAGAAVGCSACGECLRVGETAQCDGENHSCDSVDDPPTDDEIVCKVGTNPEVQLGEMTKYQCNWYSCDTLGVTQVTFDCFYQGNCYSPGELIDESTCLKCVSDGVSSNLEQGCRKNGQCIDLGGTIRVNCKTKECVRIGDRLRLVNADNQPTPCSCLSRCYPLGEFEYGSLCATCREDGTAKYSCKLYNGDCLAAGEEEAAPSLGCYRMKCTYISEDRAYKLHKAPGQSLRCLLPGGGCLDENEKATVNGVTYTCIGGDVCLHENKPVPVGEMVESNCHELVCEESLVDGAKVFTMAVAKYGCKYGDTCKERNSEYEIDCKTYRCEVAEGAKYADHKIVSEKCQSDGICIEKGVSYWTDECAKRTCQDDLTLEVTETACKVADTCLKVGESLMVNGVNTTCSDNKEQAQNNSQSNSVTHCRFTSGETVPRGETIEKNCNTYICEERNSVCSLYIIGEPKCKITSGDKEICFPAGTTKYCVSCQYDADNAARQITYQQECIGDGDSCVAPGVNATYRCGTATCDPVTMRMQTLEKNECSYGGQCYSQDNARPLDHNGSTYYCTCKDLELNRISCTSESPNA